MSTTEGRLYPDYGRLLDPEDAEFSYVMNSLMHIEKGNGQNFKKQRDDAANELIQWATERRVTADVPSPVGKTYGIALGASLAWKAVKSNSEQANGSTELQGLLSEWQTNPPYALFWAEVQAGYLALLTDEQPSVVKAQRLASHFKEKLSELPITSATNATIGDTQSLSSLGSAMSQKTMPDSEFFTFLARVSSLTEEQPQA